MYEDERKIAILNKLQKSNSATVAYFAQKFNVSESTIRRDLTDMEKSGLVRRTHGGVILNTVDNHDYNYGKKKNVDYDLKQCIAKKAAGMVQDNTTIYMGNSTITTLVAQMLEARNLTVVTNSIDVINILSHRPEYELVILGGTYVNMSHSIEGLNSLNQILQMHFHLAFIGLNGIDSDFGISTASDIEANSKMAVISNSNITYFLAEHKKFDIQSKYKICDIEKCNIITDNTIPDETLAEYRKKANIIVG